MGRLFTPRMVDAVQATIDAGIPWAADNDGFQGVDFGAYTRMIGRLAGMPAGLFVVAPDVVADSAETLVRFERWEPILHDLALPVALAAQNGLEDRTIPWDRFEALFIGGDTEWKLGPAAARIVAEAKARGKWVHMGRVNTFQRIRYCRDIGVDSIDGTNWVRWTDRYMPRFHQEIAQGRLG